ncbi:CYTH domain-containing protein [Rahnella sp. L72c]|uniref:CYTH domain-containing protein n=1 Tax=Rahnella perminowiae TaxID=2816244 RepID=A0ABS6KZ50_9GAMM|nr:CYTH domain-containing protein [Rahnella perminowiae]MBU9834761.1 CYTH domain-containing protein [Rahnella perminowiae]
MFEIERKFLITSDKWRDSIFSKQRITQGYMTVDNEINSIRVRVIDKEAWITVKSAGELKRQEYDYRIPYPDACKMLASLARGNIIEKIRYRILIGEFIFEVDIFEGVNEGLCFAEIEMTREDEIIPLPDWIGEEVTHDHRYYGSYIGQNPYINWE